MTEFTENSELPSSRVRYAFYFVYLPTAECCIVYVIRCAVYLSAV
jgi:hypothetical protein